MPTSIGPGDLLAERYRLDVLLNESGGGRFWRARDRILSRDVAVHVIAPDDPRADRLMEAARRSAVLLDRRILRVLDADRVGDLCYVVNEWADGESLDRLLEAGPLQPERAAWIAYEVGAVITGAHAASLTHGRLNPENVLVDTTGTVRLIGFAVDAALSGVPTEDIATNIERDVHDLGGILYAGLTGRWAGVSTSERVAPAPREGGVLLHPRQVTAGIPTALDSICSQVLSGRRGLHARGTFDYETARGVTDALLGYLGDPAVQAEAEAARQSQGGGRRRRVSEPPSDVLADLPRDPIHDGPSPTGTHLLAAPAVAPDREAPPLPAGPPAALADPLTDTAARGLEFDPAHSGGAPGQAAPEEADADRTQAGMPIFMGDDHVEWLNAEPPPPPPVLPEPEPKPLFAPDPPAGEPVRRARLVEPTAPASDDFWPFDSAPSEAPATAFAASLGQRAARSGPALPGRLWLRVAGAVGVVLLLILAVGVAYNLGLGNNILGSSPDRSPEPSSGITVEAVKLAPTGAVDFDPWGDPPQENPELVPNVIDGDRETAWNTASYLQQLGPDGLKPGVGVTIDLGGKHAVTRVDLRLKGATGFSVALTAEAPVTAADLDPASLSEGQGKTTVTWDEPVAARYVTVWLTRLPAVDGGFRGEISEVTVWGE